MVGQQSDHRQGHEQRAQGHEPHEHGHGQHERSHETHEHGHEPHEQRGHAHDAQARETHAHETHGHEHGGPGDQIRVGVLTASDRGSRGERADVSGPTVHNLVVDRMGGKVAQYKIVPDEREAIESTLIQWADHERLDLILTTGGTGFSARDVTPEATRAVVERETPGIVQAMLFETLRITPYAMLSRAVAGIRKQTLIVNLPGSPKAVEENLGAIVEVLPHAVKIMRGADQSASPGAAPGAAHEGHDGHDGHEHARGMHAGHAEPGHSEEGEHREHREHAKHGEAAERQPQATAVPGAVPGGIARNVPAPPC